VSTHELGLKYSVNSVHSFGRYIFVQYSNTNSTFDKLDLLYTYVRTEYNNHPIDSFVRGDHLLIVAVS